MKPIRLIDLKGQTFDIAIDGRISIELIYQKLLNDYNYNTSQCYFCRSGKILDNRCLQKEIFDEKTLDNPIIIFNNLRFPDKSYPKVDNIYNFHFSRYYDNFININTANSQNQDPIDSNTRYQSLHDRLLDLMSQEFVGQEEFGSFITNYDQLGNNPDINISDSDSDDDEQTERTEQTNDTNNHFDSIYTTPNDFLDMQPRYENNDGIYVGNGISFHRPLYTTETNFSLNNEETDRLMADIFSMGVTDFHFSRYYDFLENTRNEGNQNDQQNTQIDQPNQAQRNNQADQQNNERNQRRDLADIFSIGQNGLFLGDTRNDGDQNDRQNTQNDQPNQAQRNNQNEIQNQQENRQNLHPPPPNQNQIPLFNLLNDQSILNQQIIESLNLDINLNEVDNQAISRLVQIGYDRATVIQVYCACDRNEEAAMNVLISMG